MKNENERERDVPEDKVVNFLGIKRSWWRFTSKIYTFVLLGYGFWYTLFDLKHEGSFSEWVQIVGQHMLLASGLLMLTLYAGAHIGDVLMMLHDWYRERLARRRRETEAKLREAVAALHATEEQWRASEESRRAEAEQRRAVEASRDAAEEARRRAAETASQLRQDLDAWHAWDRRRRQAAEKGEPFHEPSPTGTDSRNDAS